MSSILIFVLSVLASFWSVTNCPVHLPHPSPCSFLILRLCLPPVSVSALLRQQGQLASQQWAAGCPSYQRPSACDARSCLPGRPWLPDDDDTRAAASLPKLSTGTCLLHTGTGRAHRKADVEVVMHPDIQYAYPFIYIPLLFLLILFPSTSHYPCLVPISNLCCHTPAIPSPGRNPRLLPRHQPCWIWYLW